MSSPSFHASADANARRQALDPARSFVVRAPAGSGKTELLIQRYLALLAQVKRPEAIVAITFTKKAAGEMRARILDALRAAAKNEAMEQAHEQVTRDLALQALERDRALKWNLLEHPGRMRVQTMDSLWMSIAAEMPWLSRLGDMPRIEEDTRVLYDEAARRTLLEPSTEHDEWLEIFLGHLDNSGAQAQQLIAWMLAKRDQWIEFTFHSEDEDRAALDAALRLAIQRNLMTVDGLVPGSAREAWLYLARFTGKQVEEWPQTKAEDIDSWLRLTEVVLTKDDWRKRRGLNKNVGFPPGSDAQKDACAQLIEHLQQPEGLGEALKALRDLPGLQCSEPQWTVLRAMLRVLRQAAAQLQLVFLERGEIDFCELAMAAGRALGDSSHPTDLAFKLDSRIDHLLIDEFQDTSRAQFDLVKKLTADWQAGDGRTLFLVGDPMQSIYRFRQADVGLFMLTEAQGIGAMALEPLQLTFNYRSVPAIVDRVNQLCAGSFPATDEMETGAVAYRASQAAPKDEPNPTRPQLSLFEPLDEKGEREGSVTWDIFEDTGDSAAAEEQEATRVLQRVREAPEGSIAILVRARTHLTQIVSALKAAGIAYRAVDVDPLHERATARDLLSLTLAMLHRADRISWLAILRAPWCGLGLADMEALVKSDLKRTIWECLRNLSSLTGDGRGRAQRVRGILAEAFAAQGRWPPRRWVERTWMKLGGPAVLGEEGNDALTDASAYFHLLEREQDGTGLRDLEQFRQRVSLLFAKPSAEEDPAEKRPLHVMTIHKAKGLQFDTVIVPGLGNRTRVDDPPLVLFHEWSDGEVTRRLMAPIDETAGVEDPLYHFLKTLETRKSEHERKRQFYVAMTRARTRLHLMGSAKRTKTGELRPPSASMLFDVWPALSGEDRAVQTSAAPRPRRDRTYAPKRLPASWILPDFPAPVAVVLPSQISELHEPTFEWAGDRLRHAGTVVHAFLQRMIPGSAKLPDDAAIRAALRHAGVSPHHLDSSTKRVAQALRKTLTSEKGRWILAAHQDLRAEYALTAAVDGEILRGLIDRTFIDEHGVRWVIDFKTSTHEGAGLEQFLDEQQRRYRDQMERYARILQTLGQPVRMGLYFPLLDEWREWSAEGAMHAR